MIPLRRSLFRKPLRVNTQHSSFKPQSIAKIIDMVRLSGFIFLCIALCGSCTLYQSESRKCLEASSCINTSKASQLSLRVFEACDLPPPLGLVAERDLSPMNLPPHWNQSHYKVYGGYATSMRQWMLSVQSPTHENCVFTFNSNVDFELEQKALISQTLSFLSDLL